MKNKYDVIIVGGGTAGVSCAWNCGIKGLKTLLIEQNSFLGGSITSSLVIPAMKTSENADVQMDGDMMKMLGGFSFIRFASLSEMLGIKFTKEELLDINSKLNEIEKRQS